MLRNLINQIGACTTHVLWLHKCPGLITFFFAQCTFVVQNVGCSIRNCKNEQVIQRGMGVCVNGRGQ